jgi:hypothetical protein
MVDLFCYLTTTTGETIDLTPLCTREPAPVVTPAPEPQQTLDVQDLRFTGDRIIGRVVNLGARPVRLVILTYELLDAQGVLLASGLIVPLPNTIESGGRVPFDHPARKTNAQRVKITNVQWHWDD